MYVSTFFTLSKAPLMYKLFLSPRRKFTVALFASLHFKTEALHINPIRPLHTTSLHVSSTSHHFTYYTQSPLKFTLLVTIFLTLFLKVLNLQGKMLVSLQVTFQLLIVLFTNGYLPTSVLCFLVLIFRL